MIEKRDRSERRAEKEVQENGNCFLRSTLFVFNVVKLTWFKKRKMAM